MKKPVLKFTSFILLVFTINTVLPMPVYSQSLNLPQVGKMVMPTPQYTPAIIKGIKIFPDNPLRFDFIVDTGDTGLEGDALKEESEKLIKYFLASLTTPEEDIWVNLSPYEKDRIIPNSFGQTEMGKDLLAQDYILKQLTASLMYPEDELGETFWDTIFEKAYEMYGTTDIPINTFNKVWIMPEKAVVYENEDTAFVVESRLKVMLEEDYLAMEKNSVGEGSKPSLNNSINQFKKTNNSSRTGLEPVPTKRNNFQTQIIRNVILPAIEKEVNQGKHFAQLRQIYHALILATWFKMNLKESLLGQIYVDQNKIAGVDIEDKTDKDKIYQQYLDAFKEGVYDYIKEDFELATQQIIPRKYFSGGISTKLGVNKMVKVIHSISSPINEKGPMVTVSGLLDKVMKRLKRKGNLLDLEVLETGIFQNTTELYTLLNKMNFQEDIIRDQLVQDMSKEDIYLYRGLRITQESLESIVSNGLDIKKITTKIDDIVINISYPGDPRHALPYAFDPAGAGFPSNNFISVIVQLNKERIPNWSDESNRYGYGESIPQKAIEKIFVFNKKSKSFVVVFNNSSSPINSVEQAITAIERILENPSDESLEQISSEAVDFLGKFLEHTDVNKIDLDMIEKILAEVVLSDVNEFIISRAVRALAFGLKRRPFLPLTIKAFEKGSKSLNTYISKPSQKALSQIGKISGSPVNSNLVEYKKGGIDFNPKNLNIETQGNGINYNAPIDPQLLESLTSSPIEGFTPVIFNITPILNLPALLGLNDQNEEPLQQSSLPKKDPFDHKYWNKELEMTAS